MRAMFALVLAAAALAAAAAPAADGGGAVFATIGSLGDIALATVPTAKNGSDLLTKVLARSDAQRHMETMGIVVVARGEAQKGLA